MRLLFFCPAYFCPKSETIIKVSPGNVRARCVPSGSSIRKRQSVATVAAESQPRYSPDGRFIAFVQTPERAHWAGDARVAVFSRKDGTVRQLSVSSDERPNLLGWDPASAHLYFAEMKRVNKRGPGLLGVLERPMRLDASDVMRVLSTRSAFVDTRPATAFAARHIPGTLNIPLNRSYTTWAGSLLPYDRDLYLLIDDNVAERADEAARDLAMIGLDRIAGYFGVDALTAWEQAGRPLVSVPQLSAEELAAMLSQREVEVIDVRGANEWEAGHLPAVANIPLASLRARVAEIPTDRLVVLHCQSGSRSAIAASVLRARGVERVANLSGGFAEWRDAGLPVVVERR